LAHSGGVPGTEILSRVYSYMSISGLCEIGEKREAAHVCQRCGGAVCDNHYVDELGVCVNCADQSGQGDIGGGEPGRTHKNQDDVPQFR